MNSCVKYTFIFIAIVSIIINIIFICFSLQKTPKCISKSAKHMEHNDHSLVFADLSAVEYKQVRDYMWKQPDLNISKKATASPSENFIFLIDLRLPKKSDVLRYLDMNEKKPDREASVVVFYGSLGKIEEYVVGPLPQPTYRKTVTLQKYKTQPPINARPVTVGEYMQLFAFIHKQVFKNLTKLLLESFNVSKESILHPFEGMPRGVKSGDRRTWFAFFRDYSGMYIHPVGFEVLINHSNTNCEYWTVDKLMYNGQYFDTVEELKNKYEAGKIIKIVFTPIENYASLKPRVKPAEISPQQYYPQGQRFSVQKNQVLYLDWSFAFGLSSLTGMRVFDVRFKGERIAYEISVQEAMSVYGSITPGMMLTKFLDSSIGIGRFAHELVRGIDCPYTATYVDTYRYIDFNAAQRFRNSICIFEHDTGRPLRRHFFDFFHYGYGGMPNTALVLRTITSIGNYDYLWDFIFYQSGSIEAKVHATGYISSSYYVKGNLQFGHQVANHTIGNIHTHFVNFKVDLDVLGSGDTVGYWEKAKIPHLVEKLINTEQDAAMRYDRKTPRYLHIASNRTNRWGHHRSYRLQVFSFTGDHLPQTEPEEKSMSWARYKVAITKYKDDELTSSSLYSQNDMWSPAVDFSKFIEDNESIVQQDLVAWVTTGFLHIPHAEDIPNTVTVGNGGGVILRPHNYFDEDPSVNSPDAVYITPKAEQSCETNRMACFDQGTCSPTVPPFTYNGFEGSLQFEE